MEHEIEILESDTDYASAQDLESYNTKRTVSGGTDEGCILLGRRENGYREGHGVTFLQDPWSCCTT